MGHDEVLGEAFESLHGWNPLDEGPRPGDPVIPPAPDGTNGAMLGLATTRALITELEARAMISQFSGELMDGVTRSTEHGPPIPHAALEILRYWFADAPGGLDYATTDVLFDADRMQRQITAVLTMCDTAEAWAERMKYPAPRWIGQVRAVLEQTR